MAQLSRVSNSLRSRLYGSTLIALAVSTLAVSTAVPAKALPPGPGASSIVAALPKDVSPVAARCIGNRRNYRDYNHCWLRRHKSRRAASYCSRICR